MSPPPKKILTLLIKYMFWSSICTHPAIHTHTVPSLHTHLCLDEVIALGANVFEKGQDIHCSFILYLLEHAVDHNICAGPSYASTTQRREKVRANPNLINPLQPFSLPKYKMLMFSIFISSLLDNKQFQYGNLFR